MTVPSSLVVMVPKQEFKLENAVVTSCEFKVAFDSKCLRVADESADYRQPTNLIAPMPRGKSNQGCSPHCIFFA